MDTQTPDMFPETIKPAKFKRGDVVHLNGARTHMTVGKTVGTDVECIWLTSTYERTGSVFHEDCLTLVTP